MATYVNDLRLKEIATGDESGTWGTSTNTNLELIAEAFSYGTEAITTNADTHTTTIADGASDPGRALYLKYTGTLDSACTITIGPNTVSKVWIVENGTSGSQDIILSQGSGANITIPAGDTKVVYSDGAGAGAAFFDAFASLSVVDLTATGIVTAAGTSVFTNLDISGDIDVDGTTNLDVVDIDGAVDMASTALVTGVLTANGGAVFNETGADVDFRVESDTVDHALFVQGSDGSVGIGASSPNTKLEVTGDISGTWTPEATRFVGSQYLTGSDYQLGMKTTMDTRETQIFAKAADTGGYVTIATGTTPSERLRVDGSGNVGIGTSSPGSKVTINDPGTGIALTNAASGNFNIGLLAGTGSPNAYIFQRANAPLLFGTNNVEAMRIDSSGKLLVGSTANLGTALLNVAGGIDVADSDYPYLKLKLASSESIVEAAGQYQNMTVGGTGANGYLRFKTADTERMRIDSSGNVLVGTTNNAYSHIAVFDGSIGVVSDGNSTRCFEAFLVSNENWNVSDTAVRVGKNGTTSRSINAGGTINASGADYAEYMKKADSCGTIAKGDVCGVDSTGKLTDVFADAISFVIKSTDPSYVGGDAWGDVDLGLTEEQTETERQKYDRIAFSGQVPVNITGSFNVGDYVYPQVNGTAIECVAKSSPTFEEYQLCVGKIWATQDDGRPFVAVKIG
jgi:hypothetical protein